MEDNKKPQDIQAFPMDYRHEGYRMEQGMGLRDYFAAKAMQALFTGNRRSISEVSNEAYMVADAMLKEREKQ